jgi:DNA-binding MarR family transcriptional regulator
MTPSGSGLPPTLLALTTYLLSLTGKTARGRLAARLAERDLRLWHMAVLASLADFGTHSQRGLGERLSVDASDMAKVVDQLAGAGYVARARDTADRRRFVVGITPAGREALRELVAEAESVQDELLAPLSPRERTQLHDLLARVFPPTRPVRPGT